MKKLLHALGMIGKYYLYGFAIQLLFLNFMHAAPTNGQSSLNIKEVYLNLDLHEATLSESFNAIKQETEFSFIYDQALDNNPLPVNLQVKNQSLESVLLSLAASHHLSFKQVDNRISVKQVKRNNPEKALILEVTVSGTVRDSNGEPMPGVTVSVSGTTIGTATDMDGNYILSVPEGSTLVFSFIGFESQQVTVGNQTVIDVTLIEDMASLDEVVVVGYGTQKKSQITGSISSISTKDIQELPITDAAEALQGRASGVMVLSSGNRPGQGATLRVRGNRSLTASNEPLFVVDGIPLEGNINDINPRDIESMEVLKDASATAIYGSRGANGVVLVTTKRGGNYNTVVSYSGHSGFSQARNLPDMMNAEQYVEMKKVSERPFLTLELDAIERGVDTDWVNLVLENGFQHNHQLSVRGGDAKTQFAISGNYFKERGVIKTQDFNRNTLRVNLDHAVSGQIKVGTSTQVSRQVQNWGSDLFSVLGRLTPLGEPFDENGNVIPGYITADPRMWNVMTDLEDGAYVDERIRLRVFSNIYAQFDILKNLNYRINFGTDLQDSRRGLFQGSETSAREGTLSRAGKYHDQNYTNTFENIISFSESFAETHSLNITGLYSFQTSKSENTSVEVADLPYETQLFHNIGSTSVIQNLSSSLSEWGIMSYMGRINYQLMERYLLTVTGRYDGSSRLAKGKQWGFFPSIALGWHIIGEPFMSGQNFFSDLKVRGSYGITGNTGINPYQTRGGLSRTYYAFGNNSGFGYRPTSVANPDLQWETSNTANIGVDFGFLGERIAGSLEVYQTYTSNLLLARNIPVTSGFTSVLQNIGETKNKGFEVNITSRNINTSKFGWTTNLNFFSNKEEIIELYGNGEDDIGNEWFIGEPLRVYYDYDKIGIWQLDEADQALTHGLEPGQIKIRDVNDDGILNEQDRVLIGSPMPKLNFGLGNRLNYKGFDLSFFLFGSFGQTIFNQFNVAHTELAGRYNNLNVDYWTPDNPTNDHPKPNSSFERPLYSTTRGYMPGSFLKVRNIQFGYNLPESMLAHFGIQYMRVYVNSNDPFIFSKLEVNIDPENYGGTVSLGNQPNTRLFTVGVNIDF